MPAVMDGVAVSHSIILMLMVIPPLLMLMGCASFSELSQGCPGRMEYRSAAYDSIVQKSHHEGITENNARIRLNQILARLQTACRNDANLLKQFPDSSVVTLFYCPGDVLIAHTKDSSLSGIMVPFFDDTSRVDTSFPYCLGIQVKVLRMVSVVDILVTNEKRKYCSYGRNNGGRSRASILRVVNQAFQTMKYVYNARLRQRPNLQGRLEVAFTIDGYGRVIYSYVRKSTLNDCPLERNEFEIVNSLAFEPLSNSSDLTEVTYPFVFPP